jgi:hypothetical protein
MRHDPCSPYGRSAMPDDDLVSLYSLERKHQVHRDTLVKRCWHKSIPIVLRPESTPRYRTRCVRRGDVARLTARLPVRRSISSGGSITGAA